MLHYRDNDFDAVRPTSKRSIHRYSPTRLRSEEMLKADRSVFGRAMMRQRWSIERFFGSLSSNHSGLSHLLVWGCSWLCVRNWIASKLILRAAELPTEERH